MRIHDARAALDALHGVLPLFAGLGTGLLVMGVVLVGLWLPGALRREPATDLLGSVLVVGVLAAICLPVDAFFLWLSLQ